MGIEKPSGLRWILGIVNPTLKIPPFGVSVGPWHIVSAGGWLTLRLPIGDAIETALDLTLDAINASVDALWAVIRIVPDIPGIIWGLTLDIYDLGRKITADIWNLSLTVGRWIADSAADTLSKVGDALAWTASLLWEGIRQAKKEVMDWIPGQIGQVFAAFLLLYRFELNVLTTFAKDINDFFGDPEDWLWNKIEKILIRFW